MGIEHPDITWALRTGYPRNRYYDEDENDLEEYWEDDSIWEDD